MSIEFTDKKNIIAILRGSGLDIKKNIQILSDVYKEKTGKQLNKGCPACVQLMLLTLKNIFQMTQFKFKKQAVQYKNKKGDKTTISNSTMTDEKAVEFLRTDPKRISLFSVFPLNWKMLVENGIEDESEEEREVRLAIEAEAKALEDSKNINIESREELLKIPLKELRAKYPDIKAVSINDFIDKLLIKE